MCMLISCSMCGHSCCIWSWELRKMRMREITLCWCPTRWYKSAGCDKQIYTVDSELFTPAAAFTIIYTHRIYNPAATVPVIKTKTEGFTGDHQHNSGQCEKQRCESLKLAQTESTWQSIVYKSLIQHSACVIEEWPGILTRKSWRECYNVSNVTKPGRKQWLRCEAGLGKLTTGEKLDCSLVFGKRC